jgi:hypothetical protein
MEAQAVKVAVFRRRRPDDPYRVSINGLPQIFGEGESEDAAVENLMEKYPEQFPADAHVERLHCRNCGGF